MNPPADIPGPVTESRLEGSAALDRLSIRQILLLMNRQDRTASRAVARVLPAIGQAVAAIVRGFRAGGRLIYVGAGTSGRLGVLDASECPPTFGTPPHLVSAIIAGGMEACWRPVEGAEDSAEDGAAQVALREVGPHDCVVGISASGSTPFVLGAVRQAHARGAVTIGVCCNPQTALAAETDHPIVLEVGPEVLTGSTRLKSGTAQKMVLNMLSTVSLVKSGRVYGNLMVGLMMTSQKLRQRAVRILKEELFLDEAAAGRLLESAGDSVAMALLMQRAGLDAPAARHLLEAHGQNMREALESLRPRDSA